MSDLQQYYDDIAHDYSQREQSAYHRYLNDASADILDTWLPHGLTLDAGCGCGHIMSRLTNTDRTVIGSDLSLNMIQNCAAKGNNPLTQASVLAMPFPADAFSGAFCLRVIPHITNPLTALAELSRVVKPGGTVIIDIYNRHSMRTAIKLMIATMSKHPEFSIPTRFDSACEMKQLLPETLELTDCSGLRIITPTGHLLNLPLLGPLTVKMENLLNRSVATRLGGFLLLKLTVTR